jgi:hypothetical protein
MSTPIAIPAVSVTNAQDGTSTHANGSLGHTMRSIEKRLHLDFWSIDLREGGAGVRGDYGGRDDGISAGSDF